MAFSAREKRLLVVLAVVASSGAIYSMYSAAGPDAGLQPPLTADNRGRAGGAAIAAPDVHLEALARERPKPGESSRNLFRFRAAPVPARTPARNAPAVFTPPPPTTPSGPPPLPPIPLKLVMVVQQGEGQRLAYLSDAFGRQIPAREGETIEGRYKVLRVTERTVEMSYLDGRGRQTFRLGTP